MVKAIEAIAGRMIEGVPDHASARRMQAEVNRLRLGAEALDKVNANRSPTDTPAAHALKLAKMARKFDTEITAGLNRCGEIIRESHQDIRRRIDEKVDLRPDAFASEIRAAFRGLNGKAKAILLKELAEGNRGPEMAAIVKAPSILTGISDQEREQYELSILARHAGAEIDEREKLEEVFYAVLVATKAATDFAKGLTDPVRLAEIERSAAASDAAGAAFDQSMQ